MTEVASRTLGSRPRPRTALPRTDPIEAKDRNARGPGQGHRRKCSPNKKGLKIFFQAISKKGKQKESLQIFREISGVFLYNFKNEQIPTIVGTDANAHRTIRGFFDINPLGEDLLAYCVRADLIFRNVGNKTTFRTKTREEVLNLTLVNWCAWDRIVGWHVNKVLSFSDHLYIILLYWDHMYFRLQVRSKIQNQAEMLRNVRRTCWNKYVDKLEQKLNEQISPPVPVPCSKEDIDVLANKVHLVITKSYKAGCPMLKSLRLS